MKRSFQGLSIAIKIVRIVEELMEIDPNEVCDSLPLYGRNSLVKEDIEQRKKVGKKIKIMDKADRDE